MSGPVPRPLTVAESDGNPTVRPTSEIAFNSADFVVADQGGGTVRVDAHPGAGASLTDTYVGFGDASNLLTGSANFTFDGDRTLKFQGATPRFYIGDTDVSTAENEMLLMMKSGANSFIYDRDDDSTLNLGRGDISNIIKLHATKIVLNDVGNDINTVISTDSTAEFVKVDAGVENVGIGGAPDSGVERLHVMGTGTVDMVMIESTDTGASSAPDLVLYRNAPGADSDFIGRLDFRGENSGGSADVDYAVQFGKITDVSEGAGSLGLFAAGNAALNADDSQLIVFGRTGLTGNPGLVSVNNAGRSDVDFRVNGDTIPAIYVDASQDNVGIGGAPDSGVERLHVQGTGTGDLMMLESTDDGSSSAPRLVLYRDSASPAVNDDLGRIRWRGKHDGGGDVNYADIYCEIQNAGDGSEQSRTRFEMVKSGTEGIEWLRASSSGVEFNAFKNDINIIMNGDTLDDLFLLDASQDNIGIGGAPDSNVERLHIKGTSTGTLVRMESTDASADAAPTLEYYRNSGTPASNDYLARVYHTGNNASGVPHVYVQESSYIVDATAGAEDGLLYWQVITNGTLREKMRMRESMVEVNALARDDCDFRVRGDTTSDLLFIDVSQDNIGVGATPVSGGAEFQVEADASFLLPINAYTANHDIAAYQAHGYALQMKTGAGTGTFTLPATGVVGMHVTCINFGSGMNVAVDASSSHKINGGGSAGNSTTATVTAAGARYDLVYIAADVWNCTAPAVVTAS